MDYIKGKLIELNALKNEMKRLNKHKRSINQRIGNLERDIKYFLENNDQKGITYRGVTVKLENKERRVRKKESERTAEIKGVLEKIGVRDPTITKELMDAMRGPKKAISKINIKSK